MGYLLLTALFIKVTLCLMWSGPCWVISLTLLSFPKILAILLVSDVLFMIPLFSQALCQIHVPSLWSNTD